jgi:ferredoxin
MRVTVDREVCIGAGQCVLAAPNVFDQDDNDGRVMLLTPDPDKADHAAVQNAVHVCPSGAVTAAD